MSEDDIKIKRLGKNPLSFLTSEETKEGEASANILKNKLISKAIEKCIHRQYDKYYGYHYCISTKSRQRGVLGKDWQEKCGKCHVKEVLLDEVEPPKKANLKVVNKVFCVHS